MFVPTSSELYASAAAKDAEAGELDDAAALLATYADRLDMLVAFIRTTRMEKHVEDVWASAAATESREELSWTWTLLLGTLHDLEDEVVAWRREADELEDEAASLEVSAGRQRAIEELERRESPASYTSTSGVDCEPDPLSRPDLLIPEPLHGGVRYCKGSFS